MALELQPGRPDALLALGRAYLAQRRLAAAIDALEHYASAGTVYSSQSGLLLASALRQAGRTSEALREITYARRHQQSHPMWAAIENQQ